MFKLTKALLNNLNDKTYIKHKYKLELYDLSTKNQVLLDKNSYQMQYITKLEESHRHNNLKVYVKNMAKLRAKQATIFMAPILLGGLTIASFATVKFTKMKTVDKVYQTTALEFDENSLLSQEETIYAHNYSSLFDHIKYVDENIQNGSNYSPSYAIFYYGEGSDSLQVKFDINKDNTWQYNSHTNYLYQKSDNTPSEPIGTLDEKYKNLIREAVETFIKEADLSEKEVSYLREIVSNNENDIIVKLNKCEILYDVDLEIYAYHWLRCTLAIIADIVLVILTIKYFSDFKEVQKVIVDDGKLGEPYGTVFQNLFRAALEYRQAFLTAEENRINSINDILISNGSNVDILSKYEKKLVKEKAKKLEMK